MLIDYFKFLPVEIILDILIRLPAETIVTCKSVSAAWRSLIRHPTFSKIHLQYLNHLSTEYGKLSFLAFTDGDIQKFHYLEYNQNHDQLTTPTIQRIARFDFTHPFRCTNFLGSCNGLICISRGPSVCIRNPITRECLVLSEIKTDCRIYYPSFGFGYVASTDKYKVVKIYVRETQFAEVYIYTLGSGKGWRNLGKFKPELNFNICGWQQGVFAEGALYWWDIKSEMIAIFDLAEEKFCENISQPPLPTVLRDHSIGVLDGVLSFDVHMSDQGDKYCDVWLLKKKNDDYDMKEGEEHQSLGWTKEFRIERSRSVAITKTNGVLTRKGNGLNIYDTKTSTSKMLVKFKDLLRQVSPHMNTLVSLKQLGEEDTKTMDSSFKQLQEDGEGLYLDTGNLL